MWKKLAEKYRSDAAYRAVVDVLADRYGDKMASAIKVTAKREDRDSFWVRLAKKYRNDAGYRSTVNSQAAQGCKEARAIQALAFIQARAA